ncbi:MAG: LysR family transcriptional regulator [Proteobacteria bacterium]|nr:LysR family transcriptional regulator [Pseudomonadota bacterium]
MPNLEWLRAFAAFAEHKNFTHAARALHISQPALHAQVSKLTANLGVPLYRRVGRLIELTASGVDVACFAREISERVEEFRDFLREGTSQQPVVLAAGEGAYLYLLGPAIKAFTREHEVPLRLLTKSRSAAIEALRSGSAHIAVAALDGLPAHDDLELTRFVAVPQVLVVPSSHPLAARNRVQLGDLAEMNLVVPPPEREHRRVVEAALDAAGVRWHVAVEASGWELILHFVQLGLGCAVVNGCCRIPPGFAAPIVADLPAQHYYVMHRRGYLGASAHALEQLIQTLTAPAACLESETSEKDFFG